MKTKKHHLESFLWDTLNHSWSADIYSSGGVTHTVYIEAVDDCGKVVEKYDKTFTGENSRQRAFDYAKDNRKNSTDIHSKWMQPVIRDASTLIGMSGTEISKHFTLSNSYDNELLETVHDCSFRADPRSILRAVFEQGIAISCLFELDGDYQLYSVFRHNENAERLA